MSRDEDVDGPVLRAGAGWFTGDHSHSGHSDGRTATSAGARIPAPAHRVFDAARSAGLDFIALSDDNTTSHWIHVDRLQPDDDRTLLLHAQEVTTYYWNIFNDIASFASINHPARTDDEQCMGCHWDHLDAATCRS